jgi:hypothetical protein
MLRTIDAMTSWHPTLGFCLCQSSAIFASEHIGQCIGLYSTQPQNALGKRGGGGAMGAVRCPLPPTWGPGDLLGVLLGSSSSLPVNPAPLSRGYAVAS